MRKRPMTEIPNLGELHSSKALSMCNVQLGSEERTEAGLGEYAVIGASSSVT